MADPMKIRATMKGDVAEIRVLMSHPMESGLRKDAAGNAVPAHFIQSMAVEVGGKKIVDGQLAGSVSRNPVFGFKMKGAKAGDKVVVNWVDSKGDKRTDEAAIA
ncbi:MAG: thiosulfate oxidation carrier complex protein SoxZ [Sulfuritalea sp.]|jgi:sulfur-oxidizing protein SoxZ|nr:thiosulfate oxidation carrier complex protein SoxZ [Sulfuritalea sp.]